jgi:hypothetical protein
VSHDETIPIITLLYMIYFGGICKRKRSGGVSPYNSVKRSDKRCPSLGLALQRFLERNDPLLSQKQFPAPIFNFPFVPAANQFCCCSRRKCATFQIRDSCA